MQPRGPGEAPAFCLSCGEALSDDVEACGACGAPVPRPCPDCGALVPAGARFCGSCGGRLAPTAQRSARGETARGETARGDRKEGRSSLLERKFVTVMFVDMIGSLAAIRDRDPEEAHALFSRALALATEAIHEFGGTILSSAGDGLLAMFGAPFAQEDHAERSCHAALRVLEVLERARRTEDVLEVRIGLHSGEVVVGTTANDFSVDYDATGATVHIASRLQQAAPAGRAALSETTNALVQGHFASAILGSMEIKGLARPLPIFVLDRSLQDASGGRSAGLFIGRRRESALLAEAYRAARAGAGGLLLVVGEAGIGKTSLINRFLASLKGVGAIARGAVDRYHEAPPFYSFQSLLRDLHRDGPAAEDDSSTESDPQIRSALLALFDEQALPESWTRLDPHSRNRLVRRAILRQLLQQSGSGPLVVVIEDIQHADSASLSLLAELAKAAVGHRLLVLTSCRPDFRPPWTGAQGVRALRLGQLSDSESSALAARLIGSTLPDTLTRDAIERCKGNPLFLHETIKILKGRDDQPEGSASVRPSKGSLGGAPASPATVRAVISERVDRLAPDVREVLLAASVLGMEVSTELLSRLLSRPVPALVRQLAVLEREELLRPDQQAGPKAYAFGHPLFQEVCYNTLLRQKRATLHAAAFAALDSGEGASDSRLESLAWHAFNGGLWERAKEYCHAAGLNAAFKHAPREAAAHLRNAVDAMTRSERQIASLEEAIDIRLALRTALVQLLNLAEAEKVIEETHALARELGDQRRLSQVLGLVAVHAYLRGDSLGALEPARQGLALARRNGDCSGLVAPGIYLAQSLYALGRYGESAAVLEPIVPLAAQQQTAKFPVLPLRPESMCRYWLAIAKAELGRLDEAEALAETMLSEASKVQVYDRIYANTILGFIRMVRGAYPEALAVSREALDTAKSIDFPYLTPVLASQVGLLSAKVGQTEEGLALGRLALETVSRSGVRAGHSRWRARYAEICMLAEQHDEAREQLDQAIAIAEQADEMGYLATALGLRARLVAEGGGDPAAAMHDLERALRISHRLEIRPNFAKCLYYLAVLEQSRGSSESARRKRRNAIRLFGTLHMGAWKELAEASAVADA